MVQRSLSAIAFADVVGWSRLVQADAAKAAHTWSEVRHSVIEPHIEANGGRLCEVEGDAVLVEFSSAIQAAHWALDVQSALAPAQRQVEEAWQLVMRIGLSSGETVRAGSKPVGLPVIEAARIQTMALPGEVVTTSSIRDHVIGVDSARFVDLGDHRLHNIDHPVRVYRLTRRDAASESGLFQWGLLPTVAVLPFRDDGLDPSFQYFGEGITEDIIAGLARTRSFHVIERSSTLRYRSEKIDVQSAARELGVRYVLMGSVRRLAQALRIRFELVDAAMRRTLWSERLDGSMEDVFAFQDSIAKRVIGMIEPRLVDAELSRVERSPAERLGAYDCCLKAISLMHSMSQRDIAQAGELLERAIAIDPAFPRAHAYQAWWYNFLAGELRSYDRIADSQRAEAAARRAVELDPSDAFSLAIAAHVQAFLHGRLDDAADMFEQALAINPNSAFAWTTSAATYCYAGNAAEARRRLEIGRQLSPFDRMQFWHWTTAGIASLVAGDYADAITWLAKARQVRPHYMACLRTLCAALALDQRVSEAQAVAAEVLQLQPDFSVRQFVGWYPMVSPFLENYARGLALSGIPE
jgi:adenylate cyclase